MALPLAIIISVGHMSKGLAKFVSWVGFLPYALKESGGTQTAMGITQGILPKPHEFLSLPTVACVASILVGLGVFFASRVTKTAQPESRYRYLLLKASFATFFLFVILGHALSGR